MVLKAFLDTFCHNHSVGLKGSDSAQSVTGVLLTAPSELRVRVKDSIHCESSILMSVILWCVACRLRCHHKCSAALAVSSPDSGSHGSPAAGTPSTPVVSDSPASDCLPQAGRSMSGGSTWVCLCLKITS